MLFICLIVTFVVQELISWRCNLTIGSNRWHSILLPLALTLLESIFEAPLIIGAIGPGVGPLAIGFSSFILTGVGVPISEGICASAMLATGFPLSFVFVSIRPGVDPIAMGLTGTPFSEVGVLATGVGGREALPDAVAVAHAFGPFAVVEFFGEDPLVATLPMRLPLLELPLIHIPIRIPLIPPPMPLILVPLPFIYPIGLVLHDPPPLPDRLPLPLHALPEVHGVGEALDGEQGARTEVLEVDLAGLGEVGVQDELKGVGVRVLRSTLGQ